MYQYQAQAVRTGPKVQTFRYVASASEPGAERFEKKADVFGPITIRRITYNVRQGSVFLSWADGNIIAILSGEGEFDFTRFGGLAGADNIHLTTQDFLAGSGYTIEIEIGGSAVVPVLGAPNFTYPIGGAAWSSPYTPPAIRATGTKAEGTGDIAPAWPTHATNDIGLLIVETQNNAVATPAGGWNALTAYGTGTADAAGAVGLATFWKRAASGAESAPTVTDPGDHASAIIISISGVSTGGTPADVQSGGSVSGSPTKTLASLTTLIDQSLVIQAIVHAQDSVAGSGSFSNWTNGSLGAIDANEIFDDATNSGAGGGFGVTWGIKAIAGPIGTTTVDSAQAGSHAATSISFRPLGS